MIFCKDCDENMACCDFCLYAMHEAWYTPDGEHHIGGPIGCNLHLDDEHQEIADNCGVCSDFHCFREPEVGRK